MFFVTTTENTSKYIKAQFSSHTRYKFRIPYRRQLKIHHSPTLRKQYQHSLLLILGTNQMHRFFSQLQKNNSNDGSPPQRKQLYYLFLYSHNSKA